MWGSKMKNVKRSIVRMVLALVMVFGLALGSGGTAEAAGSVTYTNAAQIAQMVFKGYVPMSSEAVNLSGDRTYSVLQAIESGTGLTYGLYYNYGSELTDSYYPEFITGEYEKIKAGIIEEVNGLSEYYSAVCGASIIKHEILGNGLRRTVFDNGVEVYVNYTDGEISSPYGTVSGHNYLLKTP